ncbi:MAG: hypothetical protein LBC74_08315 [Planctomycetaceae bacterium]|nr:hypothetical protein [Planctomycetaceae bacterium]
MRSFLVFVFVCLFSGFAFADNSSKAMALLKGVEQKFRKVDCFFIRYTEHRKEEGKTVEQVVKFERGKILKEHLPNERFVGIKSLLLGDSMYVMHGQKATEVLSVVDLKSVNAYGADTYDPRQLCITPDPVHSNSLEGCLLMHDNLKFSVEEIEYKGKRVNRVFWEGQRGKLFEQWEFVIEEPGFHILKCSIKLPLNNEYSLESEYNNPAFFPFPTQIRAMHTKGKDKEVIVFDRTITINEVEIKKSFPPETFTLKGLNLPLNTDVTDIRIHRRLGYWDGEKLVDNPVKISAQESKKLELEKAQNSPGFYLRVVFIGLGILLILPAIIKLLLKVKGK